MSGTNNHGVTGSPIENLSALAGKLQEAAEALLTFCRSTTSEEDPPEAEANAEADDQGPKPGEYRQYYLPPHTLREENELLERYKVENVADALDAIYSDLFTTVFLMKGYETDDEVDSFNLCLIGEQLSRSLDMLSKAGSVLTDYSLVHVMRVPSA